MSAVSVLSSAAGSDSRLVDAAKETSSDHVVPVDTSKLVFRGNENEWYCFMVLKKPKDQDLNEALQEADGEDVLDAENRMDGVDDATKKKKKKAKQQREAVADSDDAAGSSDEDDSEDEEGGSKKGKRRKQDTRTSIHCGKDPYGFIRTKNRESPLTVNESLLKSMSTGPGPPCERRLSLPAVSATAAGHDQGRTANSSTAAPSHTKRKASAISPAFPSSKASKPRQKRKTFSYHMVSIIGPFACEQHARIIEVLWNFKSRAVAPRVVWAKVIADKFSKNVWHDMQNVFTLRYYEVLHVDHNVYLRLRRAWSQRGEEFTTDLEMFMRDRRISDAL